MRWVLPLLALALAGCISYCRADPLLARAAKGDRAAIDEAGELGRPRVPSTAEALPSIQKAFEAVAPALSSTNLELRVSALEALRHLSERAPDVYRNHYPGIFELCLKDPSPEVRWRACWALGRIGESSPGLRAAALDAEDEVARAALEALGRALDPEALPALSRGLDREGTRQAATATLVRFAGRELESAEAWKKWIAEQERLRGIAPIGS